MVEFLSGSEISKRVGRRSQGSWQEVAGDAEKQYGERGRMLAILQRPMSLQWSVLACENLLREAGFDVNWIVKITRQGLTLKGLRLAIQGARVLLEQDVCPAYLKSGRCRRKSCALHHCVEN